MITVILIIHIVLAVCIICSVLLQKSEGGGLGIGGSGSGAGGGFMTARGTASFMTKFTAFLGACFFLTSIILALLSSNNTPSIADEVKKSIEKSSTNEPTVPLGN